MKLSEKKRQSIIDAAVIEFRTQGFQATSMDRVAATAGVSKRTVYNHFASKEALFDAIVQILLASGLAQVTVSYSADPVAEQLRRMAALKLEVLRRSDIIDLARVVVAECMRSPQQAQAVLEQLDEPEAGLHDWFEQAIAEGRLKGMDVSFAVRQFFGLLKAFAFWPSLMQGHSVLDDGTTEQLIDETVAMFLARYGTNVL